MTAGVKMPPLPAVAVQRFYQLGREDRLRVARNMHNACEYYEAIIAMLEAGDAAKAAMLAEKVKRLERENAALRDRLALVEEMEDRLGFPAPKEARTPAAREIIAVIAKCWGQRPEDVTGDARGWHVSAARHVAVWLIYCCCKGATLPWTGKQLERRGELKAAALHLAQQHGWRLLQVPGEKK